MKKKLSKKGKVLELNGKKVSQAQKDFFDYMCKHGYANGGSVPQLENIMLQPKEYDNPDIGWYPDPNTPKRWKMGQELRQDPEILRDLKANDWELDKKMDFNQMQQVPFYYGLFDKEYRDSQKKAGDITQKELNEFNMKNKKKFGGKLKKANNGMDMNPENWLKNAPKAQYPQSYNNGLMPNPQDNQYFSNENDTVLGAKIGFENGFPVSQRPSQFPINQNFSPINYPQQLNSISTPKKDNSKLQQFGQDMLSGIENQDIKVPSMMPKITGSKHWDMASRNFDKGLNQFVQAGEAIVSGFTGGAGAMGGMKGGNLPQMGQTEGIQSMKPQEENFGLGKLNTMGFKHGGKLPKAMGGMAIGEAITHGVSGLGFMGAGAMESGAALLDTVGNFNINNYVKKQEADNLRQSIFSGNENQTPYQNYGQGFSGGNPAFYEAGGMNKYKAYNQGGLANVEVENMETIQTPQGLIEDIHGATHSQGGIPMNLPENTKIFSQKLKNPFSGKSYAKEAKQFETKKDFKMLEKDKTFLDPIAKKTLEMNITKKNELSNELFNTMEENKLMGKHGTKVKEEALNNYKMEFGGLTKYATKGKVDNNPPLAGTKGIGKDNFLGDLDAVYVNAKALGYKGSKDIGELQSWAKTKDPKTVADFMTTVRPNKKAIDIWNRNMKEMGKPEAKNWKDVSMNYLSDNERLEAFGDNLWDYRFPKMTSGQKPTPFKPKEVKPSDVVSTIETENLKGSGFNFGKIRPANLNINIPDTYPRDQIATKILDPSYINPRYLDIQPQLNEVNRGVNAFQSNIGDRSSANISNLLQSQVNAYNQKQNIFGQKYNYDQNQDAQSQQFNAQSKMATDRVNLQEFGNFTDKIAGREGTITAQKNIDQNARMQNLYNQDAYDERSSEISRMFNPSQYSNAPAYTFNGLTAINSPDIDKTNYKIVNGVRVPVSAVDYEGKKNGGSVKKLKLKLKSKKIS